MDPCWFFCNTNNTDCTFDCHCHQVVLLKRSAAKTEVFKSRRSKFQAQDHIVLRSMQFKQL